MLNLRTHFCITAMVSACFVTSLSAQIDLSSNQQIQYVGKISDSNGNFGSVLSDDDYFGQTVKAIDDLDGDGRTEILVGAVLHDDVGAVFVVTLDSIGNVYNHTEITEGSSGFSGDLDNGDEFGASIATIGDLDGNGVKDLIVGAPYDDDDAVNAGALWVLFLNSSFQVIDDSKISNSSGNLNAVLESAGRLGVSACALGDYNNDGYEDIMVGQPLADYNGSNTGGVWVLSLDGNGSVVGEALISNTSGNLGYTHASDDRFGFSTESLGDMNGDGMLDVAVSAGNYDGTGGENNGAVYVFSLTDSATATNGVRIANGEGGLNLPSGTFKNFGRELSSIGDITADGRTELLVGAWTESVNSSRDGSAYLISLDSSFAVYRQWSINADSFTFNLDEDDFFGSGVSFIGDFDHDGNPNLVIGARGDDDGGTDRGAVYLFNVFSEDAGTPTLVHFHSDSRDAFSVYPNPVTEEFRIRLNQHIPSEIMLYNASGVFIKKYTVPYGASTEPHLLRLPETLPHGIYLLKIETHQETQTIRFAH